MTNEIKEILDNLKEVWVSPDGDYMNNELDERKTNLLLDYITNLQEENENLQSKIDKAIDKLESLLPMCIMPNNMLIHGTEKAKAIEETLDILRGDE